MTFQERRIKRRLLRELVDENVDLISGGSGRPGRRRPGRLARVARMALLVATPLALVASTLVISGAVLPGFSSAHGRVGELGTEPSADVLERPAQGAKAPGPEPATADTAPDEADLLAAFTTPEPIDASVFPLGVRRIVLDPGHGGENLGTKTPRGLEEKFLTLDITHRVEQALVERGFEVLLTRQGDDSVTLQERAQLANDERADIFVSVHVNWLVGSRESGIETYYLGPTDDPFLTSLAARENRESGHTLAELREILDGIYAGVRHDKSQELAASIQRSMVRSLRKVNRAVRDRGVKTAPFLVLVDTKMPAVLAEVAALSNEAEAEMLEKPLYRDYIADSLAAGILAYAEALGQPPELPAPEPRATSIAAVEAP